MPIYSDLPDVERMALAELALNNAKGDPDTLAVLTNFGYPEARIDEGLALVTAAQNAHRTQDQQRGEQFAATDALEAQREAVYERYMRHVKLARVALADDRGAQEDLGLDGVRSRDLEGWIDQARNFYTSALATPAVLSALAPYGMTAPALTTARAEVEAVEEARRTTREEREDAQSATVSRRAALDALDAYMSDFIKVARVAFADDPQRLERLGLVTP